VRRRLLLLLPLSVACHGAAGSDASDAALSQVAEEPPIDPAGVGAAIDAAGGAPRVVELSLAGAISFALYSDGTVRAWGRPTESQLDAVPLTLDGQMEHDLPIQLQGLTGVRQVSTGTSHTCVLGQDNVARCWGLSLNGALAAGIEHNRLEPKPITDGEGVAEIQARDRLCVRYLTGEARCLGDQMTVVKPIPSLGGVQRVTSNSRRACAIRTNGAVACWGLVFGRDQPHASYWDQYSASDRPDLYHAFAVEVRGLTEVRAVTLAGNHVCAIAKGDELYCWGVGAFGELGDGKSGDPDESTSYQSFSPKKVLDLPPVEAVAAGYGFTCAVTTEGKAMCWGMNVRGELGLGDTKQRLRATEVPGVDHLVQIAAGDAHVCALRSDGAVFCWGDDSGGQLGIGPVPKEGFVPTPTEVTALAR
jgi:alpha-tubulin suppressor-like RCC1 family protein